MPVSVQAHRRAIGLMLVSAASFTVNVLLIRELGALHAANIWVISCARFVVGLAMIVAVYRAEVRFSHLWRNPRLAERGIVGGIGVYLTYLTVVKIGAGRAIFINNTYVIFGALLAAWLLRERLRSSLLVGSVAALAGLALLTNVFATGARPGFYDFVAVVSALLSAWVIVVIRRLHADEHTSTIFSAQCVFGLLVCGGPAIVTAASLSAQAWLLTGAAGVAAGVGQLTMTRSFRDLSVAEGSLLQMLAPVGVAVGGLVFFGEHFSVHETLGAALILAGTLFTALRR
jgi:drug/metabolite transporter (DMT)-like permease